MKSEFFDIVIKRHGVRPGRTNPFSDTVVGASLTLTDFQARLLDERAPVRIASAPTGAGKTFAFELAPLIDLNVLFIVPTRRLAQNLEGAVREIMHSNGWDNEEVKHRLAVWTSDSMQTLTAQGWTKAEIRQLRVRQLRGRDGFRESGTFIIATPESVGQLLLNPPRRESGQPAMFLTDLLTRDHIVFDEFHLIEERGFGLAAALCRVTSGLSSEGQRPSITFLSATPIDIAGVLEAFDVPAEEIAIFEERVDSWRTGEEPPGARIVHGEVEVSAGRYADALEACRGERDAIVRTLDSGKAIVVILDSVAKLKAARIDFSNIFQRHDVDPENILTINSIDDAHRAFQDSHSTGGRSRDPMKARVILATSSVEIGVTFGASLMIMDPGHNSCSFIQRVGRVSRGDLPGRVVLAGRVATSPLRGIRKIGASDSASDQPKEIDVREFVGSVLHDVVGEFRANDDRIPGSSLQTYRAMSNRAIWCACLFWCALRREWEIFLGERSTLWEFQPRKVKAFEAKLRELEKTDLDRPKEWVRAFVREATRFRDIEPRLRVRYEARTDTVPESMIGRYTELLSSPIFEDKEGFYFELRCPLESILKTSETKPFRSKLLPLAPLEGMIIPEVERRSAADAFALTLEQSTRHPFGHEGDRCCELVAALVRMTGVVPHESEEDVSASHQGSGVM